MFGFCDGECVYLFVFDEVVDFGDGEEDIVDGVVEEIGYCWCRVFVGDVNEV